MLFSCLPILVHRFILGTIKYTKKTFRRRRCIRPTGNCKPARLERVLALADDFALPPLPRPDILHTGTKQRQIDANSANWQYETLRQHWSIFAIYTRFWARKITRCDRVTLWPFSHFYRIPQISHGYQCLSFARLPRCGFALDQYPAMIWLYQRWSISTVLFRCAILRLTNIALITGNNPIKTMFENFPFYEPLNLLIYKSLDSLYVQNLPYHLISWSIQWSYCRKTK